MFNATIISNPGNSQIQNAPIKIVIAEDYPLFASGISAVVNTKPNLSLCATFVNGQGLLDWYNGFNADVILLDLNMPMLNNEQTSTQLLANFPEVKIIVLSVNDNKLSVDAMRDIGICGYLTKDIDPDNFIQAILKVHAGEKVFPENTLVENHQTDKPGAALLSKRELEILKLIVTGNSNKEVADLFNLSTLTIKKHRENLMHKLNAHNSAQLIESARAKGLI